MVKVLTFFFSFFIILQNHANTEKYNQDFVKVAFGKRCGGKYGDHINKLKNKEKNPLISLKPYGRLTPMHGRILSMSRLPRNAQKTTHKGMKRPRPHMLMDLFHLK